MAPLRPKRLRSCGCDHLRAPVLGLDSLNCRGGNRAQPKLWASQVVVSWTPPSMGTHRPLALPRRAPRRCWPPLRRRTLTFASSIEIRLLASACMTCRAAQGAPSADCAGSPRGECGRWLFGVQEERSIPAQHRMRSVPNVRVVPRPHIVGMFRLGIWLSHLHRPPSVCRVGRALFGGVACSDIHGCSRWYDGHVARWTHDRIRTPALRTHVRCEGVLCHDVDDVVGVVGAARLHVRLGIDDRLRPPNSYARPGITHIALQRTRGLRSAGRLQRTSRGPGASAPTCDPPALAHAGL